jgi:hypothetical protein
MKDRSPRQEEPAEECDGGEPCGDRMIEEQGGGNGACEGSEVRGNVVDRGDEPLVYDVGDSDEETARKRHGQKQTHHRRSVKQSDEAAGFQLTRYVL